MGYSIFIILRTVEKFREMVKTFVLYNIRIQLNLIHLIMCDDTQTF